MLGSLYKILFFLGSGGGVKMGLLDKTILICTFIQYLYFFLRLAVMVLAFFQDQRAEGEFSSCCLRNTIWLSNPVLWGPLLWVTSRVYTNTGKNPWMNNWENLKNGESANNRVIIRGIRIRQISRMLSNMYKNICSFGNNTRHEL